MSVRRIEDAGRRIAGARKNWKIEGMAVADLDGMTVEEKAVEIRKDNVWPKPDYAALVAAGMPREVAAAVKIIRDRIPATPSLKSARTQETGRDGYVRMLSDVRGRLLACRSMSEVSRLYDGVVASFGGMNDIWKEPTSREAFCSIIGGKYSPMSFTSGDHRKAEGMVAAGFPEDVPAWKRNVKFYQRDGRLVAFRSGKQIGSFATEAEAFEELRRRHESAVAVPAGERKSPVAPPERPDLDFLVRDGMSDHRKGMDVDPERFIDVFGFVGLEWGNWVPDVERQIILNHAYDGLMDMAEILGFDERDMSLGGRLSAAFGSRGKGGRRAAEYNPALKVFHFTRTNGSGNLAHEFSHGLDHLVGLGTRIMSRSGVPSVTGWDKPLPRPVSQVLAHHGPEVGFAYEHLLSSLQTKRRTKADHLADLQSWTPRYEAAIREQNAQYEVLIAEGRLAASRIVGRDIAANELSLSKNLARIEKDAALPDVHDFGTGDTRYMMEARRIGGHKPEPCEMFARAFECFVFDEIADKGGRSDYLVHGVEEDRYADRDEFKGNPYPTGDEREDFRLLFRRAMDVTLPIMEAVREDAAHVYGR